MWSRTYSFDMSCVLTWEVNKLHKISGLSQLCNIAYLVSTEYCMSTCVPNLLAWYKEPLTRVWRCLSMYKVLAPCNRLQASTAFIQHLVHSSWSNSPFIVSRQRNSFTSIYIIHFWGTSETYMCPWQVIDVYSWGDVLRQRLLMMLMTWMLKEFLNCGKSGDQAIDLWKKHARFQEDFGNNSQ